MAKKIIGDLEVSRNVIIAGENSIRQVNGVNATQNGKVDIPLYSIKEVDKILSTLPVSRVGTMDYLPLNINGSFEGATNYTPNGIYPCILENDGTLVYLRPGTNGSTIGYYYCYTKSARTNVDLTPVLTNEKFKPSFFTPNHKIISFVGSNAGEVLVMYTNNGSSDTITVSLTNGTLNSDSHQSVEFPKSLIVGTNPQYALISNDKVYIIGLDSYNLGAEFSFSIYTITVSDIINGVFTSLSKISGISGSNLFGDSVSGSPNIKLAPKLFSTIPAEKSLYCIPTGNAFTNFVPFWGNAEGSIHAETSGNNIRIVYMKTAYAVTTSTLVINNTNISLVFNINSKNYTVDNTNKGQVTITTDANGNIAWNNPYFVDSLKYYGLSYHIMGDARCPTVFTTKDGLQFTIISVSSNETVHRISRCQLSSFTSAYDSWNFNVYNSNSMFVDTISPIFGSAIGENIINPTIISKNKIIVKCTGTVNGITAPDGATAFSSLGNNRNFVYDSISGNSLTGFAPNIDRGILNNADNRYSGCITLMNQDGSTEVYGSSFIEGFGKYSALSMDQNTLQYNQEITIGSSVLSILKSSVLSGVTLNAPVRNSKIVLYYIPNSTLSTSYAITTVITDVSPGVSNLFYIVSEVSVEFLNNTVQSATVLSNYLVSLNSYGTNLNYTFVHMQAGLIVAKYIDFTYIGIPSLINTSIVGTHMFGEIICKVNNSTKRIYGTPRFIRSSWVSNASTLCSASVLPGIGFGLYENGPITDIKTKLIFKNYGTTEAQFDAMSANTNSEPLERIVVTSQDVPEGYTVYFTQEVPVFLSGKFFKLPPQFINLEDLFSTVQNKTFYIYVSIVNDLPQYQISETLLTEDLFRTYIGTITTDATNIRSIQTEKVTRFLTYRMSTSKRGSAVPSSSGVPSSTGTRWN